MRLLIVEDNLFFVTRVEAALRSAGHQTRLVSSARDALAYADERPDAAVVDLHCPGALGLIPDLRKAGIPVAAYCGHAETDLRKQAKEAGASVLLANSDIPAALERALLFITAERGAADEGTN